MQSQPSAFHWLIVLTGQPKQAGGGDGGGKWVDAITCGLTEM